MRNMVRLDAWLRVQNEQNGVKYWALGDPHKNKKQDKMSVNEHNLGPIT